MGTQAKENPNIWGEPIYQYTRTQAIEDGVLVAVNPELLKEIGIKFPMALTSTVWEKYVKVPEGLEFQDVTGRLWDVLWMLKMAMHRQRDRASQLLFTVLIQNKADRPAQPVQLKAVCGPGDQGKPVITIMLPEED